MLVTPSGIVIDVKPEHLAKASSPMLVTSSPIIYSLTCEPNMFCMLLSERYDFERIAFEFMVTDVSLEQPKKALQELLVTPLPIVTDVRPEQL